jgi:uncharacterized membrane protein
MTLSTKLKIAFACNLVCVLLLILGGMVYLFSPQIMPYHQEAVGMEWDEIDSRMQIMLLSLLKGAGLAAIVSGVAMGILLLVPFQHGDAWSRWAIPAVGFMLLLPAVCIAAKLAIVTGALIPWTLLFIPIVLLIFGFFLSTDLKR